MPIETTLLALPVTDLAILGVLAASCCLLGWQVRRLASRGREAALQRSLFESKGAVPQLEAAVRSREQRAEALTLELKALKGRIADQEAAARQQENQLAKRDRDIRTLNSELAIVKDGASTEQMLLDGGSASADTASADPDLAKRHAGLEARYEAMKRGMIKRDDRIAELENAIRNPDNDVPTRTLERELSEIEQTAETLKASLQERDKQLEALQTHLQEEVAERQALEDLARRRSEGNRELKAAAAGYEQQIPQLMKTIQTHNARIAERETRLQAVSGDLTSERRTREKREAELKDLQAQLAAATAKQRDLQQRLSEQDQVRQALDAELERTRETLRASESLVRTHEASIASAERQVVEANERAEAGERTAVTLRHTIKDRDFKIEELGAMARQQAAKLEMLRNTFSEAKQAHKAHIDELEMRHTAQSRVLDALTAEHEWLRAEATAHDTRVAKLEQDITGQSETLASQRSEGHARAEELETSRRELTTARQTVDALSRQVANLADLLARSRSALRLSHCTNLHLVARLGSPRLLLPSPLTQADVTAAPEADRPAVVAAQV